MSESLETVLAVGGLLAGLALVFILIQRLRLIRELRVLSDLIAFLYRVDC
jgi:hypothetical protein